MQFFKVADGGNPDGTAKDGVIGVSAGTKYKSAVWNDNFFNILDYVVGQGYSLIDGDLEQFTKALKGKYQPAFTYNTSAPATQTVADVVEGSDGIFYECQTDALSGENPVGSVTENWKVKRFDHIDITNKTLSYAMTDAATDILTNVQNQRKYIKLTGALTADRILQVDISIEHELVIENATTGGFNVTVQGATGTGIVILFSEWAKLYCNGTNVIDNGTPFSVNQKLYDATSVRAISVPEVNNSGRTIKLIVSDMNASAITVRIILKLNGVRTEANMKEGTTAGTYLSASLIIKNGDTYELDALSVGTFTWQELRNDTPA